MQISNGIGEQYRIKAEELTKPRFRWKDTAIAQLTCMLHRFEILDEDALKKLTQADIGSLTKEHSDSWKLNGIKITFLAKLLSGIQKANPDLSAKQLLRFASALQHHISRDNDINTVVPLFGLSINKKFCKMARHLPELSEKKGTPLFKIETNGAFTNLIATPELSAALKQAKEEETLRLRYLNFANDALKAIMATLLCRPDTPALLSTAYLAYLAGLIAIATAYKAKSVDRIAIASLTVYAGIIMIANTESFLRYPAYIAVLAANLAFSLHKIPGFNNQEVIANKRLSPKAIPLSLWKNFDKSYAALITLILFDIEYSAKEESTQSSVITPTLSATLITVLPAFMLAIKAKLVGIDIRIKAHSEKFLFNNLLLVCMAEEATFRLLLQGGLEKIMPAPVALTLASTAFG